MRHIIAITGASGIIYGIELLANIPEKDEKILIMSENAKLLLKKETDFSLKKIYSLANEVYENSQLTAPVASGSNPFDTMVISPCSASTFSKIACGISDNLITRTAAVAIKERRKLIIVPRETPLSTIHLQHLTTLSRLGIIVFLPSPPFYPKPETVSDIVNFVTGRTLDLMGIKNELYRRWER